MKLRSLMLAMPLAALGVGIAIAATNADIAYPEEYRNWRHIKSMVIGQGHPLYDSFGGIHHIYANENAMEGYRVGNFPDGAVIVFDLYEATADSHAIIAGARKVLGVMQKDRRKFAATGGWGFEGFAGDSQTERLVRSNGAQACFGCHLAQKHADYVFSKLDQN